jgi:hypothetical protein
LLSVNAVVFRRTRQKSLQLLTWRKRQRADMERDIGWWLLWLLRQGNTSGNKQNDCAKPCGKHCKPPVQLRNSCFPGE